jgi:hypothetical protein
VRRLTIDWMHLQPGAVHDLVVDSHLETIVVDDEDADAAPAVVERLGQTSDETALVEDGKALLDIARLSHGNNATILTDVKDAVLLEDGAEHVLDNDGGGRVGDEARLFMELLGEEVDTKVAVLASLGRGGDTDDLARAALKDQEVTNADVVARDGDGVCGSHLACGGGGRGDVGRVGGVRDLGRGSRVRGLGCGCGEGRGAVDTNDALDRCSGLDGAGGLDGGDGSGVLVLDDYFLTTVVVLGGDVGVLGVVVVTGRVDGVRDAFGDLVSCLVDTVTE